MKFTERGSKVHISRTGTDEAGDKKAGDKKGDKKKEIVGTLRRPDYAIEEELRSKLSPEELQEVEGYVVRARRSVSVDQEYAVANFVETLTKVSGWVKTADAEEVKAFHERVRKPLTKLRRQFASSVAGSGASSGKEAEGGDDEG